MARSTGWSLEYITEELTDIDIYELLEGFCNLERKELVKKLNINTLAIAAGRGEKKAITKIKEINKKENNKNKIEQNQEILKQKQKNKENLTVPRYTEKEISALADNLLKQKRGIVDGTKRR